jgi:hypothetical protein
MESPDEQSTASPVLLGVDLYWLPLGAGGHSVRVNGIVYEALVASFQRRPRCDLYRSALEIRVPGGRFVIEMTPVKAGEGTEREVVAGGAVGARWAGHLRIFRYEVRRWRDGFIPDVAEAVDSPRRVTSDPDAAQRVLDLVPSVSTPVWGRDELTTGDMWSSNSVSHGSLLAAGWRWNRSVHRRAAARLAGRRALPLLVARCRQSSRR